MLSLTYYIFLSFEAKCFKFEQNYQPSAHLFNQGCDIILQFLPIFPLFLYFYLVRREIIRLEFCNIYLSFSLAIVVMFLLYDLTWYKKTGDFGKGGIYILLKVEAWYLLLLSSCCATSLPCHSPHNYYLLFIPIFLQINK